MNTDTGIVARTGTGQRESLCYRNTKQNVEFTPFFVFFSAVRTESSCSPLKHLPKSNFKTRCELLMSFCDSFLAFRKFAHERCLLFIKYIDLESRVSENPLAVILFFYFFINLVRMFAWADSRDQSLH